MGAATPTLETVLTAVKTAIDAINPSIGTAITSDRPLEDEVEWLVRGGYLANDAVSLPIVECESVDEEEGPATQEHYEIYNVIVRYWTVRANSATWSATARTNAEAIRTTLAYNATVFAISGQRQIRTPETVQLRSHGPRTITGVRGPQMIYETVLTLAVEARRWS